LMKWKLRSGILVCALGVFILIFASADARDVASKDSRNHTYKKFSSAKKAVFAVSVEKKTFYCGCPFDDKKIVDLKACGYQFRKSKKRASHVEVEHVVPADKLCGKTPEWVSGSDACVDHKGRRYKGRRCASEHNPSCEMAYNDLHNLRPAVGEINNDRSNYPFADIPGEDTTYGGCSFQIKNQKVDPPKGIRGDIARIYLHMNAAYPELHILSPAEVELFQAWSMADPVTPAECELNQRIHDLQGNYNIVVLEVCNNR